MPIYSIPPEVHGGHHHGNLHSPIGIGPRGNSVFFCSSYVDNGNDTYTAPKTSFVSTRNSGMYDPRTGDLVLFRIEHDDDSSLLIGYIFSINPIGGAITFVKLAEISTSGFSPSIGVSDITGGHRVTVTNSGGSSTFDVMDGEKGDPFEFEDFTEEQLAGLREDVASVYTSKDEAVVTTVGTNTTSITIPFADWSGSTDALFVYVEGLALTEGVDYAISGSSINLTSPITHEGTDVIFKRMTTIALDPGDLGDLVDNVANRIETLITSGDLDATTSTSGAMSATDKAKLDGIAANARYVDVFDTTRGSGAEVVSFLLRNANGTQQSAPSAIKADSSGYIKMSSIANGSIPNSKLATPYSLPIATTSAIGGVKPDGTTVTVDNDGTVHAAEQYTLPTMSTNTKGGAMVGDGLAMTGDALGIADGGVDMDMLSQEVQEAIAEGSGGGSGYNPSLAVGRADALTGADETAQWATRESTGTGSATVRSVQGAAVAWNQLVPDGNFTDATKWRPQAALACSTSVADNTLRVTVIDNAAEGRPNAQPVTAFETAVLGHKYLLCAEILNNTGSACSADVLYATNTGPLVSVPFNGEWYKYAQIVTCDNATATLGMLYVNERVGTMQNGAYVEWRNYAIYDLTAMFGSGNEPATVADFERMYPASYYPYSAPTLKPVQIAGIASTDAQGNALDSVEWETQTLRAAGSVADVLYSDHVDVKVGERAYQSGDESDATVRTDGTTTYYPLETPTTTPISAALPMTYRVEQGGSESIIVPEGELSAAPLITLAEGESAAELVMDALSCIAAPDGPVATANHAINTYLTMGGKLYKVTSAIAVGETIAAGTNVTQTTVMSELIARTA